MRLVGTSAVYSSYKTSAISLAVLAIACAAVCCLSVCMPAELHIHVHLPGTFKLTLDFSEDYPNKAPVVKFKSTMFHPNSERQQCIYCHPEKHALLRDW